MDENQISVAMFEASKARLLDGDSFTLVGFNAKGKLDNIKFGSLRKEPEIGTVMFNITMIDDDGKVGASKRKWAYASYLEPILGAKKKAKAGKEAYMEYDGKPVQIIDGVISSVK